VAADEDSQVNEVLVYFRSVAPKDVLRTVAILESKGWNLQGVRGGSSEPFGNVLVQLTSTEGAIKIVRDRSQWMMDIKLASWSSWFDLGVVIDAKEGRRSWGASFGNPYTVKQLPPGVRWAAVLPEMLAWLSGVNDIESQLTDCRERRFESFFPGLHADE